MTTTELLDRQRYVFWDFDGVIKDSVKVKSDAFKQLFEPFGSLVVNKVKMHHEENGGISRFEKLPLYLNWAGETLSDKLIYEYSTKFSKLVKQKVIDSQWVPGVFDYLEGNYQDRIYFLITATPQNEIVEILHTLGIEHYFNEVVGSPVKKDFAIDKIIRKYSITPDEALMIGDSSSDYEAATSNKVPFLLRRTLLNRSLQEEYSCLMINDFINI